MMFAIKSIFFLINIYLCYGVRARPARCAPDTIDFETKFEKSSIVVYGKVMANSLYEDDESRFHAFFQVDCILKGPATARQINITNAGVVPGKQYCQELPAGRGYSIVFLEPMSSNKTDFKTFTPADFTDIPFETNSTDKLLARLCKLKQTAPLFTSIPAAELCPAVSTDPTCITFESTSKDIKSNTFHDTTITTSVADLKEQSNGIVIISFNKNESSDVLLPEKTNASFHFVQSKSGVNQIDVDQKNGATAIVHSILLLIVLLVCSSEL